MAARRKQAKRRKAILILAILAIIAVTVLLSSRLGGSYIKESIPCWTPPSPPRIVLVEFGLIYVLDEDPQWMQAKRSLDDLPILLER
jgi:hypothetical protein